MRTRPVIDVFQRRSVASLTDAVHLEGVHFRLLRRILAKTPEERVTRDRVLRLMEVPPLLALLRQKRLRWVGHALRRAPTDRSPLNVLDQLNKPESRWTQLIQSDCNAANIPVDNLERLAADRTAFRQLTCARTFC